MARSGHQKEKLMRLMEILRTRSDEDHPLSTQELISALEEYGISAERKSVYDDIETLQLMGFEVEQLRGRGYYLAERELALPELKLLVDAVQSSKFISEKKSRDLISRLEGFCSRYEAGELQRQVYVTGRVKTMNESVFYSIDAIHDAIHQNRRLTFRYFDYDLHKEKVFRRGGAVYQVSPCALLRSDESYYLVALNKDGQRRHYRVDRMDRPAVAKEPRLSGAGDLDVAEYSKVHFGMFTGERAQVHLRCRKELAHVILDRFGMDVMLVPDGADAFTVTVTAVVSSQFFGWLFGLGGGVEILAPASVRDAFALQLDRYLALHSAPLMPGR